MGLFTSDEHYIQPTQLCIGLYVHLDLTWTQHPFTFSSFKIKSLDQISTIQGLGLTRVRYSPNKSDCEPLPPAAEATSPPASSEASATGINSATDIKRARLARLEAQRAKTAASEKSLVSAAKTIRSINQNVFSRPDEVRESAKELIAGIAASILVDADVSVQLMADKIGGEEVYFHSLNVSLLSMMLAKELKAPPAVVQLVGLGALFHDLGELEIPSRVLKKTDPHTAAEKKLIQQHCDYGVTIAKKMNLPPEVLQVIAQHHERVDGSGYPLQIKAAQMSLLSRIVALVNAYDELCNPANPAKALTPHEALSTMFAQQRAQFDPLAMSTFVRCLGVYPPGTLVVLSNGVTGMVVSVNTTKPLRPVVLIYDPTVPKEDAILVDLETEPDVAISKTLQPRQLPPEVHDYLSPRKRVTYQLDTDSGKVGA